MGCVSRQKFFEKRPLRTIKVPMPECGSGEYIIVRALTPLERGEIEAKSRLPDGSPNMEFLSHARQHAAISSCVDDSGAQFFTEGDLESLGSLIEESTLNKIVEATEKLRIGLSDAVADAEKNLPAPPSSTSATN